MRRGRRLRAILRASAAEHSPSAVGRQYIPSKLARMTPQRTWKPQHARLRTVQNLIVSERPPNLYAMPVRKSLMGK